jgi:choline dehydrogenase
VNAVLDGDFQVHGVANLRVVDSSSFPIVPGFFITTSIYMVGLLAIHHPCWTDDLQISEKAADVIIAAANKH